MEAWGLTDTGNVREENQDFYRMERLGPETLLAGVSRRHRLEKRKLMQFTGEKVDRYGDAKVLRQEDYPLFADACSAAADAAIAFARGEGIEHVMSAFNKS